MASGGQGELFVRDGVVYKLYHNTAELPPERKLAELAQLACDEVVVPIDPVEDTKGTYIGFTSKYVNGVPLVKLFSNAAWRHHAITSPMILELVQRLSATTTYIHSHQCLVVDGNEYNYLVDEAALQQVFFIDVDSYQTASCAATAIMPSIRDPHAAGFTQLTDWYSLAIVSFQMWTGIHPFKGKHPKVKGLEDRMRFGLSVLDPEVSYPASVRDFGLVPDEFMCWYSDLFVHGERTPPPTQVGAAPIATMQIKVVKKSAAFLLEEIRQYPAPILWHWYWEGRDVVRTKDHVYCDAREYPADGDVAVIFDGNEPIVLDEHCRCRTMDGVALPRTMRFPSSPYRFVVDNRLWVLDKGSGTLKCLGMRLHRLVTEQWWSVLPAATRLYDGVCISDILGKLHFYLPYADAKGPKCAIARVYELDGAKIMDARRRGTVVVVMTADAKLVFRFDGAFHRYDCTETVNPQAQQINFTVLDTGVMVGANDNEDIELAHAAPHSTDVKIVHDDQFNTAAILTSRGAKAAVIAGDTLHSLTLV